MTSAYDKSPGSVSPDGKSIAYSERISQARIAIAPIAGGPSSPLPPSPTTQANPAFSPDGRWLA